MINQFGDIDPSTHNDRLLKIKQLSAKQYIDDGPVALYYMIRLGQQKELHATVEFAIRELEKLYKINDS